MYWKRGGEGGSGTQNFVYGKWPDKIFSTVNFVFSHNGHFGLGVNRQSSFTVHQYGVQKHMLRTIQMTYNVFIRHKTHPYQQSNFERAT